MSTATRARHDARASTGSTPEHGNPVKFKTGRCSRCFFLREDWVNLVNLRFSKFTQLTSNYVDDDCCEQGQFQARIDVRIVTCLLGIAGVSIPMGMWWGGWMVNKVDADDLDESSRRDAGVSSEWGLARPSAV